MNFKVKFKLRWSLSLLLLLSFFELCVQQSCIRRPQGAIGDNSPVDDSFRITIEGNPATYIPGQSYNVTLSCDIAFKFISFTLVAESEAGLTYGIDMTGHFDIIDPAETRFSNLCENMIESSNTNIKHRADIAWVAPNSPNSTCVYLKAAVLQHRNVWFIDDGFLTKRICPEEIDDVNSQTPVVNPCCACDEAKYELIVERRWTRNTHAKDFPQDDWRTRFSELIGASHSYDYRFWAYGSAASPGLREMAEHGATKTLENEIKEQTESGAIRTIIKAPGVPFRKNVMSTTLATVRVDPEHHLVSFVTKIIPSPDWILGVAGLELCLANCTWIEEKVLNLFPWDVGTDGGPSYESPDQQQNPADVVRHITSTFPSDHRSPFYDETGAPMKPMATLYMTRKKLYERECEEEEDVSLECTTHPWVNWTECSTKCGAGYQYRTRSYKDPGLAARYNCEVVLRQTQECRGEQCGLQEDDEENGAQTAECELTNWTSWSACSNSCGRGFQSRTRDYRNPYARKNCQSGFPVELEQTKNCMGTDCGGTIANGYDNNDNGGFDLYNREPSILEEEPLDAGFDTRNQYKRPSKQKWSAGERYANRQSSSFGDIDQNGFGISNRDNNEQQSKRYGYGIKNNNNNNYANQNNYDDNNQDPNKFKNEHWLGSSNINEQNNNNRANNRAPFNNLENDFNMDNGNGFNSNNYDNQDPFGNAMMPQVYDQRLPSERVTDRFRSPGFNPPGGSDQTDQYNVVQNYCYEKPLVVRKTCTGRKKISNFWFFDYEDRECKIFTTDNCDGNKNKFRTLESCEGICLQPILNLEQEQSQPEQNNWNNQIQEQIGAKNNNKNGRRQPSYNLINRATNNQSGRRNQVYSKRTRV